MNHPQEIQEALFEMATEIDTPESRQALLDLIRDGDPLESERLSRLLEVRAKAESFFRKAEGARTVVAVEAGETLLDLADVAVHSEPFFQLEDEGPGKRIDRYQLKKRIGEGGCGVVYLAEQLEPVQRQVALKVIRLGMDTERVIARFGLERQALAMMDHPNIARVLDAGATETGRPYFVMEWVRGLRITDFCDENRLDLRQRIDLFLEVCKGIQHAHQKGVIHRDIKPSNILISDENGKPSPKVIDFGVAKAISDDMGSGTAVTHYDQFVGTPAYMSPEQADFKQQDIDTRSDVYSLGILLYELLTGRTPFDAKELSAAGLSGMRTIIVQREPASPSATLSAMASDELRETAALRRCDAERLRTTVRGDLDSVVMKAIEKDRAQRYDTVNGLLMDLQRYVAHEPVIARASSRIYLFRKFVRRNRLAVGATGAIAASLILGTGVASAFYFRERKAKQEQFRLREVAEAAHTSERQRFTEAREWEDFAQVSILLSEGKTEEADEQLRKTPLSSIQFSPQSSSVLRSLANWNVLRGRWQQGAECFLLLLKADDKSRADGLTNSTDALATAPALVESGKHDDYAQFRKWALSRFGNSPSNLELERVLHTTLLTPTHPRFLRKLEPIKTRLAATEFSPTKLKPGWDSESAIWRAFALALLEYRRGDFQQAKVWLERALAFNSDRDFITATLDPIHAMIWFRLGQVEVAKADLERARKKIHQAFSPELPAAYEPFGKFQGYWWDWVIARILFREAEALIGRESGR
ncbi:MAG: serine/threonine-protein kinase [Verrucomicrobiota bacterium]